MPDAIDHGKILQNNGGRDELNLAEFPITLLADRVPDGCTTLVFEDEIEDRQTGDMIRRRLVVKGDDEYGLPTAVDDEVLFALIQITRLSNDFTYRDVNFTRYEVLKLLGWRDDSVNYRRLTESLRRWKRVNLSYDKAWWNKNAKTWMSEEFNIIDNLSLPEDAGQRKGRPPKRTAQAVSSFSWNKVVFQSFQAENLKRIDAKTYFSLKSSVAKRMYRFLDKRFYHQSKWTFDLHNFAIEHIGLSRNYQRNAGKIKEKLQPGIEELEGIGYIESLPKDKLYTKSGRQWRICLIRKYTQTIPIDEPAEVVPAIAKELIDRGVTKATATELARNHDARAIADKIDALDWLVGKKDKRVMTSPAGYLVESIRKDYAPPRGFESRGAREELAKKEAEAQAKTAEQRKRQTEAEAVKAAQQARIDAYWGTLCPAQQAELMNAALEADTDRRDQIEHFKHQRLAAFAKSMEKGARDEYIARLLGEIEPS